jgi:hypothetical protein
MYAKFKQIQLLVVIRKCIVKTQLCNYEIITNTLGRNLTEPQAKQELLNWHDLITKQNYFSNREKILIQQDGLAMGAPTSGLIAEFFYTKPRRNPPHTPFKQAQNCRVFSLCR